MKKLQALIISLLLILTFAAEAKSPPPGTGKADVPANIYIMLDTSGSMGAQITGANSLYYPEDVAVDSNGNVYVVERYGHRIKKMDPSGNIIKTIGSYGYNRNGKFYYPTKIAIDTNDNIYVSDYTRIQKLNSDGVWQKNFTGQSRVRNVAVDSAGNVFAINSSGRDLFKWNSSGSSEGGISCGNACYGLTEYNGTIYATDTGAYPRIKKWRSSNLGWAGQTDIKYNYYPRDIEVTSQGVYLTNMYNNQVQKYSLSGVYQKVWGSYGTGNSQFKYAYGLGSDSSNNIYVADRNNHAIKKFDSNGNYISRIGSPPDTRMSEAMKVIKKLVSSTDLRSGANFGLQTWASSATQRVKVEKDGAINIFKSLDPTDPSYTPNWYRPSGGTNLDNSMQQAYDYFMGSGSPINANAGCQKSFLMVISDGSWRDSKGSRLAKDLFDKKGIVTFVIGFHAGGGNSNYIKLAKAGQSYPDSPLYSNNWQHLYETLSAYIRQAISARLTFSAPVIMPNISSGDHIFQSTFTYKNNHQWEGQLSKYKLDASGQLGALQWDAGDKLNKKSESSRQIWTIANHHGISTSLNNFTTSNLAGLKDALWEDFPAANPTDTQATNLINFVRGIDAYDENANLNTTEARWKLGDVYNSRLVVVGPPKANFGNWASKANTEAYYRYQNAYASFKVGTTCGGNCASRKEVVYVGANDGMLHAFDSITGEELWAFIPPTMLQSLRSMVSVKANSSNSIFGVDGSPVVKDLFYDGKWRTVLLSGMGKGGKGYFALDITTPLSPVFLFGFQNNDSDSSVNHWDESGTRTTFAYGAGIPSEYDYSKIGDTTSTPAIVLMPTALGGSKWVAVFGAGYNASTNNNFGSAIYVVDLEDKGKVLKRMTLTDSSANNNIANSAPASIVSITPDTTSKANYKGSMVYLADLEGKMWKLNLTNTGTLYEITPTFDAEATSKNDRMEFFQITPSIGTDGSLWNFYGTGDQQKLQRISADINNRIFGIKDNKFPLYSNISGLSNTASSSLKNMSTPGGVCPTKSDLGWYVNLKTNERVTGKVALFNELIYASKYTPKAGQICSPGFATLSEYSMACGSEKRTTNLGQGIATGAVIFKNKVYVGISGSAPSDVKDEQGNVVGKKTKNLIVITPSGNGGLGNGKITQESWREIY